MRVFLRLASRLGFRFGAFSVPGRQVFVQSAATMEINLMDYFKAFANLSEKDLIGFHESD